MKRKSNWLFNNIIRFEVNCKYNHGLCQLVLLLLKYNSFKCNINLSQFYNWNLKSYRSKTRNVEEKSYFNLQISKNNKKEKMVTRRKEETVVEEQKLEKWNRNFANICTCNLPFQVKIYAPSFKLPWRNRMKKKTRSKKELTKEDS